MPTVFRGSSIRKKVGIIGVGGGPKSNIYKQVVYTPKEQLLKHGLTMYKNTILQ